MKQKNKGHTRRGNSAQAGEGGGSRKIRALARRRQARKATVTAEHGREGDDDGLNTMRATSRVNSLSLCALYVCSIVTVITVGT